jgi:hypothetical protein
VTTSSESQDLAVQVEELAESLVGRGQVDDATALYERLVAIKREVLGPDHPDLARTLHDLAVLQESSGRVEQAGALWAEARRILADWDEQGA